MELNPQDDPLEILWGNLLSRQPDLIRAAYASLDAQEKQAVLLHLRRMAQEDGWHPEQQLSSQAALVVLENLASESSEI